MTEVLQVGDFLRNVRSVLRFGEWSRGPLKLLRIEMKKADVWCDWMTRPVDVWDIELPQQASEQNFTMQTLDDALKVRTMLFDTFSGIRTAELRAFRVSPGGEPELVLAGTALRDDRQPAKNISLAMQAKLLGFRFTVADGSLTRLAPDRYSSLESGFGPSLKTT